MKMQNDKHRINQINIEIKKLHRRIASLEQEANRIELGLPPVVKFDDDFIPSFLLRQKEREA